jgi:hypothetical protein
MPFKNPQEAKEYRKKYYRKNLEKLKAWNRNYSKTKQPWKRETRKKWDKENHHRYLGYSRKRNAAQREIVLAAKRMGCADCGEKDIRVIQFHAPNGHSKKVLEQRLRRSRCIGDGSRFSKKTLEYELSICIPLCANCHIRRHCDIRRIHCEFPKADKNKSWDSGQVPKP